ncbi:unnamed protein product [Calicophoron daubneyi]|uniref:WD repeat-containing protein 13 n=1 Tax=Calicophoron daubneyi TaxID=300641 RepID=A0AAV2T6C2_CALDB
MKTTSFSSEQTTAICRRFSLNAQRNLDLWQQILAQDTRFSLVRPVMRNDSACRQLYLRRRSELIRESANVTSIPSGDRLKTLSLEDSSRENSEPFADRALYNSIREKLLCYMYGPLPSLKFSSSMSFSVDQSRSMDESIRHCSSATFSTAESVRDRLTETSNSPTTAPESMSEGYAFSGIEHIFDHHKGPINRLRFANNDNGLLAMASADGTLSVCRSWPPTDVLRVLHVFSGGHAPSAAVTDVVWSLSNEFLISTAADGSVCLWDVAKYSLKRLYPAQSVGVGSALVCAYQPANFNLLVVGGSWGKVQTINLSTGKPVKKGSDQVHSTCPKGCKLTNSHNILCIGRGCVTALAFEPASGSYLWVGTDRGVIQSYICQPSSGRLTRAHRLNLGLSRPLTSLPPCDKRELQMSIKLPFQKVELHHVLDHGCTETSSRLGGLNERLRYLYGHGRIAILSDGTHTPFFPSVTSLSTYSWLSREVHDSYLLVSAAGLGLLLFQITYPAGVLTLKRCFPVDHLPPNPVAQRGVRLLHSCFAPLLSFRSGACAVAGSEDCNMYFYDVLSTKTHSRHPSPRSSIKSSSPLPYVSPSLVTVLQGHTAPVLDVSIGWDESVLASGDENGVVIIWRRKSSRDEEWK